MRKYDLGQKHEHSSCSNQAVSQLEAPTCIWAEPRPSLRLHLGLDLKWGFVTIFNIWTISPVGIGIDGKMLKKNTWKTSRKFYQFFFSALKFYNLILLKFGVAVNQILHRFGVPDKQILLHFGVPDNCSSGPGMARRIYSLSSCQGHWNGVKLDCRGHPNGVTFLF